MGEKTDWSNYLGYHCFQLYTKYYRISFSRLEIYIDEIIGDYQRNLSTTDQVFCIHEILENNGSTMRQCFNYS
jgi:hypothetical protein